MPTSLILPIFALLFSALILGEVFERLKFPAIIGELLAGLIFGPAVLGLITINSVFEGISSIALFFIILLIGLEVTTDTLRHNYRDASLFSLSSFIIPVSVMILVANFILGINLYTSVVLSISIGVPSISIISVLLKDLKLLRIKAGHVILASVVITDLVAFATVSAIVTPGDITYDVLGIAAFLILLFIGDYYMRKHSTYVVDLFKRVHARERGEKLVFGMIILGGLIAASIFELIGVTYVLGAFFAGIVISEVVVGSELQGILTRTLTRLNDSFFIPIFFSIAGIQAVIPRLDTLRNMVVLLVISAIAGALLNRYLSRRRLKGIQSKTAAGILGSRGSVGIIIASIGYNAGLMSSSLYSAAIFATIILSFGFSALLRNTSVDVAEGNS